MEVKDCILGRRTIRNYLNVPLEWEKIGEVLTAGMAAPTAGNLQNYKFIVVLDEENRKNVVQSCLNQNWMLTAPCLIVVISEPKAAERMYGVRGERLYSVQNCAAVIQNMLLRAHDLGLGSAWVGAFEEEMLRRALDITDIGRPQAVVCLGYPEEEPRPPIKVPLETQVFVESWQRKFDINVALGYTSAGVQNMIGKGKKALDEFMSKITRKEGP